MGRIPSTLPSCLLVHTALHTQPSPVLGAFPASACFHSEALPLAVHMLSLLLVLCSPTGQERVKPGAAPGQGGARGWDPREGARGLGGRRRAHRRPSERPAAGPAEAGPHGVPPPVPGISAAEKPGSSGRQKEVLGDPPSPPRSRPRPADLGNRWTLPGTPEPPVLGPPGVPCKRAPRDLLPTRATSRFSPGTGGATCGLRRGQFWAGRPTAGPPVGARGLVPLPPPAAWRGWRLRLSEGNRVQDFPSWTSGLRGARCTRVWKSGGSPPPLTPS